MFFPDEIAYPDSRVSAAAKAQQEPHEPWFLIFESNFFQSIFFALYSLRVFL